VRRFGRRSVGLIVFFFSFCGVASPQTSDLTLRRLNHRVFTVVDGAPSDIAAIAQTTDGTLWIGGRTGLTRFDGARFVPYPQPGEEPLASTNVASLLATPDGGLWMGFRPDGVAFLQHGRVARYAMQDGVPRGTVQQLALDTDGSLWAVARTGLARFDGHRWKTVDPTKIVTPYGVLVDRAGTLWVATAGGLVARGANETEFRLVDAGVYSEPAGILLTETTDGNVWAAADDQLVRVASATHRELADVATVSGIAGGPLMLDGDGNLWTAEGEERTLLRIAARDLPRKGHGQLFVEPERFARADGLGEGRVYALLDDRERNVWVGTNAGLHRFSRTNVVRDAAPQCVQYEFSAAVLVAGDAGSLWIACGRDTSDAYVGEIRGDALVQRLSAPFFTAAHRALDGTIWFAGPTALGHLENGRVVSDSLPPEVLGRPIQTLTSDGSGALWASLSRRGTYRIVDGKWHANGNLDALPEEWAFVATSDERGVVWLGYPSNRIARVEGHAVQLLGEPQGLDVGNVVSILADGEGIWVGGEQGFARFDGARFVAVRSAAGMPLRGVSGSVRARNGDLWLNGVDGITRIRRPDVERLLRDPSQPVSHETFGHLDGVPGAAVPMRPQPSATETSDDRLWFSTTGGIVSIDPTNIVRNTLPPPVTIWSLTGGSARYPNRGEVLRLPVHTTDVQIEYAANSLTVPERVRFRYKLEGLDRDWQDVGTRREALYTNLGPGRYTFRVIAANNDGVWNDTGASIGFAIAPAFYQTRWFYALCAIACLGLLAALYQVRMRQVAAQVRGRLEARLGERERIARELHDTLLQSVQGLIWRFQAATDRIPSAEPARQLMEQSLDRADELLAESRDKVKDLRPTATAAKDLPQAIAAEGEQFALGHPAEFRVSVHGTCRELHPIVREEGFLIGREALGNAFRHAGARQIEVEVSYDHAALHVRIRDDGEGINPDVLTAGGRPGHFGLIGMRERAKKLGARLEVWSKPGAGTEVELRVPGRVAYGGRKSTSRGLWSRLAARPPSPDER
jgi:signal transduction histidine kinase/ligand-binding sensor domain-containing protein